MRKTAKNMGNLSKSGKYNDSEIPKSSVFVADSISVDEETNGTKITDMRMEVLKKALALGRV